LSLVNKANLLAVRRKARRTVTYHIDVEEKRAVAELLNEVAYFLYEHYRTAYLAEADDLSDEKVGKAIGWPLRKVTKYRLELQKVGLLRIVRIGSGDGAIVKLIVGADSVALYDAGLPDKINDYTALNRLKRKFGIETAEDLIKNVSLIQDYYECHPEEFK
jgi:hypothetical protein